jgi:hypothetical protein
MDVFEVAKHMDTVMKGLKDRLECFNPEALVEMCTTVAPWRGRKSSRFDKLIE